MDLAWQQSLLAAAPEPVTGPAGASGLPSGEGDLLVMGGRCQHDWQHTVPRAASAGARLSITTRHSRPPARRAGGRRPR